MTRYAVTLPNGGQLTMDSDKNITYAIVLSPPNLDRWKARVEETLKHSRIKYRNLLLAGRKPLITSRAISGGHTMLMLTTADQPMQPVHTISYDNLSRSAGEAHLMAQAGVQMRIAKEAVENAQALLNRIEAHDVDDNDYRVIEWGGSEVTRRIGNMRGYEEQGRTLSVDRVEVVPVAREVAAPERRTLALVG